MVYTLVATPFYSKDSSNEVFDRRQARSKSLGRPTKTPNKPNRDAVTPKYYDNGDKIEDLGMAYESKVQILNRPSFTLKVDQNRRNFEKNMGL